MSRQVGVLLLSGALGLLAEISGIVAAADGAAPVHLTNEQDRQRLLDL